MRLVKLIARWAPLLAFAAALVVLEGARAGISISHGQFGPTPVTVYEGTGPSVVMAHGFAGSRQMMQGYALTLAQAGYRVHVFDFEGHGRHPIPMSGDVDAIEGTTRLLVEQTLSVVAAVGSDGPVALVGHSMATDILIRAAALEPERIGPLVMISAFSQAVTADTPSNMLFIMGAWEPGLRAFADQAVATAAPEAQRAAIVAPMAEHIGVLHSVVGRQSAVSWLNAYYARDAAPSVPATGPWTLVLLLAVVAMAWPISRWLPRLKDPNRVTLEPPYFALLLAAPVIVVPPVAVLLDPHVLPVLVADHLAVHLGLYGLVQLGLLKYWGVRLGPLGWWGLAAVLLWGLGLFGFALDRYAANFLPIAERVPIIAALCLGSVPFMVADAMVTDGGRVSLVRRMLARIAFLLSLGFAIALDFEGLFFLIMIAPVIVLFYALYGLVGRWVAQRQGALAAGFGLGLCLAWALGVSFPMFATG